MNDRIKELALKAYNNAGQGTPEHLSSFMEVYSEKFAELIVQECLSIIDERKPIVTDRVELWKQIKEHFGVDSQTNGSDIVDVCAYNPQYNDNLLLVRRDRKYITFEDYIYQKIVEQQVNVNLGQKNE